MNQEKRSVTRLAILAALVAVPVAALAGVGVFALLSGLSADRGAPGGPEGPGPVGVTGPVPTEARELTEAEETACRALLSQLPGTLDGLAQRPVTAGPEQNAAYGEPAVTVACGVPEPAYAPTDTVYSLPDPEGACWHLVEETERSVWVTLDREVPVRVTVPAAYDGPGQLVTALSGTVDETIRPDGTPLPGCGG